MTRKVILRLLVFAYHKFTDDDLADLAAEEQNRQADRDNDL